MLRSRGARPGRFHTSPRGPCVYFSRAGATARTSSSVGRASDFGVAAWPKDQTVKARNAMAALRGFIVASFLICLLLVADLFDPIHGLASSCSIAELRRAGALEARRPPNPRP